VCSVTVTCGDTECKFYNPNGCQATAIDHTADRFCTAGRNKVEPEYKQMMRYNSPIDYKRCEKDVSN